MPHANFCRRELRVPWGCYPYDHKTGPQILRTSWGNIWMYVMPSPDRSISGTKKWLLRLLSELTAGAGLWLPCDRGAALCDADANGVLPYGIWTLQTVSTKQQPSQSTKPMLYIAWASISWEYGCEAEADKDSGRYQFLTLASKPFASEWKRTTS
jgi:hypothetical protein